MENYTTDKITQESGEPTGENATCELAGGVNIDLELPELEDVDHPQVPEVKQDYIMREMGGVSDLQLLSYVIDDPDFFAMLEGEAGVGKNMAIETVLGAANWPRVRVNFGIGTTYQNLVGRYAPVESEDSEEASVDRAEAITKTAQRIFERGEGMSMDKAIELAAHSLPSGSSFQWVDGLLTRAVKNGWAFIADEINAGDEEALMPLNGVTEDRDNRYLTIEEKSEVITPHPRFRFIATRNPITYAGAGEMNSALESRSYIIEYGYHENAAIEEILRNRTDIVENESETAMKQLVDLAQAIRINEQSGNDIVTKISTRDLIKVGRLTDLMSVREATKTVFLGIADPTDKDSIREEIRSQQFN
jgi:MoxR-like ATPase